MRDVIPTISTRVIGPLGIMHLPRFWLKNLLYACGRLAHGYKHTTGTFDRMLIDTLGFDEGDMLLYCKTALPSYLEFEAWIRDHSRDITEELRDGLNQRYQETLMSEAGAETRRAELGIADPTLRTGIILNDLDDWSLLHEQLTRD